MLEWKTDRYGTGDPDNPWEESHVLAFRSKTNPTINITLKITQIEPDFIEGTDNFVIEVNNKWKECNNGTLQESKDKAMFYLACYLNELSEFTASVTEQLRQYRKEAIQNTVS